MAPRQLFDGRIPLATETLALFVEFDVSHVPDWRSLPQLDHQAACVKACNDSGLRPTTAVVARSHVVEGDATILQAQTLPRYTEWHMKKENEIRVEFLYSSDKPQLCIRILNELPKCDGVTAVRLAAAPILVCASNNCRPLQVRVALHTLEALEGNAVASLEAFKKNPPFRYGLRNFVNALRYMPRALLASLWPFSPAVSEAEAAAPTTGAGLRAYYAADAPELGLFRLYRPKEGSFKAFVSVLGEWKKAAGWEGFFSLQNYSPMAAPGVVKTSEDLLNIDKRLAGIFLPIGCPPGNEPWKVMNYLHVLLCFWRVSMPALLCRQL